MSSSGPLPSTRLVFAGRGLDRGFLDFLAERADLLSLDGWGRLTSANEVEAVLFGPAALVDMLEVACLLGPVSALVEDVTATPSADAPSTTGFHLRA